MASRQPPQQQCRQDDCAGSRLFTTTWCLAHAAEHAVDAFDAELKRIGNQGTVDARGVVLSDELLGRVLDALPRTDDRPTFTTAHFEQATFQGTARFDQARFLGDAGFRRASFQGTAGFVGTSFHGWAGFGEASFQGWAGFGGASFLDEAWFFEASFHGAAWFEGAHFSERAVFQGVQFSGAVVFFGTQFDGEVEFREAQFTEAGRLGPLRARWVDINRVVFAGRMLLEVTAGRLSWIDTRFEKGVAIRVRFADIIFDATLFAESSELRYVAAPLLPPPRETDSDGQNQRDYQLRLHLDERPLSRQGLAVRPRLLSMRRVDVENLTIPGDFDLSRCLLRGAHNLDRLRVDASKQLAATPKRWWSTRRHAIAEEHLWRQSRNPSQRWYPPSPNSLRWIAAESGEPVSPDLPSADLYRELRKAREDAKDEPGAADFYWGEMEMRRHDPSGPLAERIIIWFYWLISGYGLRAWRALATLAAVIMALAAMFHFVGFIRAPQPISYWTSLLYAARGTLSLTDNEVVLTAWGKFLQAILRVTGPVLLGLALLSIRNRVKR
jgi:hypothetical protein